MAFTREVDITKVRRKAWELVFYRPDELDSDDVQAGHLSVQIEMSDGSIEVVSFQNLLVRFQDDAAGLTHLANLALIRAYIDARIDDEVLPTP